MARLGDVCIINPKVPPIDDSMLVSFVPMQRVGEEGEFDPSELRTYADVKKGFTYFADADVLFAKITPCMENGKGAIACGMESGIGFGSTEFHVLRPNKKMMMGEWLYYLTVCPTFRKEAERNMTGSAGQKRVPKSFLENYHVNIPVLSEQHQQVQVLNNICALLSLRKQQLAKLDELVKARFVELFIGKGYPVTSIKELLVQNSTVEKISNTKIEKFVTVGIKGKGAREREIKDGKWPVPFSGYRVKEGQFIYSRIDARNGAFAILPKEVDGAVVSKDFPVFEIKADKMLPNVLLFSVLQDDFVRQIQNSSFGATNRQRIQEEVFGEYRITLPPMEIQNQFTAFVEQTDKSKLSIQQSLTQLETLKASLMQLYFG